MSDPLFDFVSQYFWLLAIGIAGLNSFVAWRRAAPEMAQKTELQEEYTRLLSGYAATQILPWLVMGLGLWVGGVPTIWSYFRPQDNDPWVLAWWGTVIGINLLLFLWVFFQGGADFLAAHPAFQPSRSRLPARLQVTLYLLGSALAMAVVWFIDLPAGM